MATWYSYAMQRYDTISEVETAVTQMKTKLDTEPSIFCTVNRLIETAEADAWQLGDNLTDSQVTSLSGSGYYSVHSKYLGYNDFGLNVTEALQKVSEYKINYGIRMKVDKYFEYTSTMEDQDDGNGGTIAMEVISMTEHNVTNEDMSGYV